MTLVVWSQNDSGLFLSTSDRAFVGGRPNAQWTVSGDAASPRSGRALAALLVAELMRFHLADVGGRTHYAAGLGRTA